MNVYLFHEPDLMAIWSALENKNNHASVLLALEICKCLQNEKRYVELETFLNALPKDDIYLKNEHITRAEISVAFEKKNFTIVYDLIENNTFQNGEDLIDIWDRAHYAEEIERTKKSLTPLSRFRIRQRFLPPKSICPARERRKFSLDETSRRILQEWLDENLTNPYPTKETKAYLSKKANITLDQVKTWFANARRRLAGMKGTEGNVSWRRYHLKKSRNKESGERRSRCSPASEDATRSDGERKIIEEPFVQGSVLSQLEDGDSATEMTVTSVSDDSETFSRRSSDDETVTSLTNGNIRENVTGLVLDYSLGNSTREQARENLPGIPLLELVEPHVIVNPSLFGPTPVSYFYDYYSCGPFDPCSSITMENGEKLERCPECPLPASYYIYPPTTLSRCTCLTPCGFPGPMMRFLTSYQELSMQEEPLLDDLCCWSDSEQDIYDSEVVRFDAAEALLDLSLKSRTPRLAADYDHEG